MSNFVEIKIMNFSEFFKELILEKSITIQKISKVTNIDDSSLYDYLHGTLPDVKSAVKLANYFNCSLNYLMGIDDGPNEVKFYQTYDLTLFSDRYDKLLKENKIAHFRLHKETGLNYSSHYAWQHGAIPNISSLIIIAKYFNVSIDYLVGRCDSY